MAVNTGLMNQREIHHVFTAKNLRKFELKVGFSTLFKPQILRHRPTLKLLSGLD